MKFLISALLLTTITAAAQEMESPCAEFEQKEIMIQNELETFGLDIVKTEMKLNRIDERIAEKEMTLAPYIEAEREIENKLIYLRSEQTRLIQAVSAAGVQLQELNQLKSDIIVYRNSAEATNNREEKRRFLQLAKQAEKQVEMLEPSLRPVIDQMAADQFELSKMPMKLQKHETDLSNAIATTTYQDSRSVPNRANLLQQRAELDMILANAHETQKQIEVRLMKAQGHVDMCVGYLQLSVKYPTALKAARAIKLKTCAKFKVNRNLSELEIEAQEEAFRTICK